MAIWRGTDWQKGFYFTNKSDGLRHDITGWELQVQFRRKVNDEEFLVELTNDNEGVVVDDPTNGHFVLHITEDDTADLPLCTLVFDVLRTDSDPGPQWLFGGTVQVRKPVTRT